MGTGEVPHICLSWGIGAVLEQTAQAFPLANQMYRARPLCSPVRGTEGGCQTGQTCFVSLGLLKTWAVLAVLSRYCWCAVRVILGVKLERAWRASVWWETLSYITYDLRVESELGWTSGKGQV